MFVDSTTRLDMMKNSPLPSYVVSLLKQEIPSSPSDSFLSFSSASSNSSSSLNEIRYERIDRVLYFLESLLNVSTLEEEKESLHEQQHEELEEESIMEKKWIEMDIIHHLLPYLHYPISSISRRTISILYNLLQSKGKLDHRPDTCSNET